MSSSIVKARHIQVWEGEGGALSPPRRLRSASLRGTPAQVEWAERIKLNVNAEFDRVAAAIRSVAHKQRGVRRAETEAILLILEDKRTKVLRKPDAGYFIRHWQEISDQVRALLFRDHRHEAIRDQRAARRLAALSHSAAPPPDGSIPS